MKDMKKFYFSMLLVLSTLLSMAQHFPQSSAAISIVSTGGTPYTLVLQGRSYPLQGNTFSLEQIQPGSYPVQIGYHWGRPPFGRFIVTYNGFIDVQPFQRWVGAINAKGILKWRAYEAMYNGGCQPPIVVCPPQQPFPSCPPPRGGYHGNNQHFPHQGYPQGQNFPHPTPQGPPIYIPGSNQYFGAASMSDNEFRALMNTINQRSFEKDKLIVAQQAVRGSYLSAGQIRQIMQQFSFESTRLEFAKYAYDYCTDRSNYYQVNDAFDFSNSISTLEDYISARR